MPIGRPCAFCGKVTSVSLWTGTCDWCWDNHPDPWLKLEELLEAGEIERRPGSLVPGLTELKAWREEKERGRERRG